MKKKLALAVCWYDETQWNNMKELDPGAMYDSYESWRKNANRAVNEMKKAGHEIKKVSIRADAFREWCKERGMEPNGDARSAYASWKLQERAD